jgi:hypothetical protein
MSSRPISIKVGSVSSARSAIGDALNSYRRVQYLIAASPLASREIRDADSVAEEGRRRYTIDDIDDTPVFPSSSSQLNDDPFVSQLTWDDEFDGSSIQTRLPNMHDKVHGTAVSSGKLPSCREDTPLLQPLSDPGSSRPDPAVHSDASQDTLTPGRVYHTTRPLQRCQSNVSSYSARPPPEGQSTFGQSVRDALV